jgi:hypothetical protein
VHERRDWALELDECSEAVHGDGAELSEMHRDGVPVRAC